MIDSNSLLQQVPASQPGQYPPSMAQPGPYGVPQSYPQPMSSDDLQDLKGEVAKLISNTQQAFAFNPADANLQSKLQALLALKKVLETQTLPPQQLEAVRNQIRNLAPTPTPTPAPAPAPLPTFVPPSATPSAIPPPQLSVPTFSPPASAPPIDLAQILANAKNLLPPASTVTPAPVPPPAPAPATTSLADLLRGIPLPTQTSSTPAITPFQPPPFSSPPTVSTPVPAPAIPVAAPAQSAAPPANLAQLLAQFSKPADVPPASIPTLSSQPPPLPQLLSQPPTVGPAPGSTEWLLNALKGLPMSGTPSNTTPIASEPMTRQSSAPANVVSDIELTTASMKK